MGVFCDRVAMYVWNYSRERNRNRVRRRRNDGSILANSNIMEYIVRVRASRNLSES